MYNAVFEPVPPFFGPPVAFLLGASQQIIVGE